ncbi:hypothetical protein GGI03_005193, partial [Coemansia sp. RSA 2337]
GIGVVVDQDQVVGEEWEEDPGADVAGDLVTASTTKITGKVQTQRQAAADEKPQLIEAATARLLDAPGHLIPVKPSSPTPWANIAWRVLYVVPPNSRSELGLAGEKIPGPFSPPLNPMTPEQAANAGPRKPQDVLRKQNEAYAMKQRVQQLLQQAADSPSGGIGTYVGRLSHNNNPLIPVLPRLDP